MDAYSSNSSFLTFSVSKSMVVVFYSSRFDDYNPVNLSVLQDIHPYTKNVIKNSAPDLSKLSFLTKKLLDFPSMVSLMFPLPQSVNISII